MVHDVPEEQGMKCTYEVQEESHHKRVNSAEELEEETSVNG